MGKADDLVCIQIFNGFFNEKPGRINIFIFSV